MKIKTRFYSYRMNLVISAWLGELCYVFLIRRVRKNCYEFSVTLHTNMVPKLHTYINAINVEIGLIVICEKALDVSNLLIMKTVSLKLVTDQKIQLSSDGSWYNSVKKDIRVIEYY